MGTPYKVASVLTENEGQPPVLVEFENGKINPDLPEPLKCKLFKASKDIKYAVVENGPTTYVGCPSSSENSVNSFYTYLAIRNRETHKVQLLRVETMRATAAVGRDMKPIGNKSEGVGENSLLDLSRKFGSKASRRAQEQKLRFTQISKTDSRDKDIIQNTVIDRNDLVASDDSTQALLPPCKLDAPTPAEVYDINDILTQEEMKALQEGFEAKEAEDEEAFIKSCSAFFNAHLDKCMKNAKNMALLLYAEYLIRLCNKKMVLNYSQVCDCSEEIAQKMCTEFTTSKGNKKTLSRSDYDKCVLRIIIIDLFLSNFKLNVQPLANSLINLNTTRLKLLVRITGANFATPSSDVAQLRVPIKPFNLTGPVFKKKRY